MRSIETTTAHRHSNNNPVDLPWEAFKSWPPITIVFQHKITIPTTIISWQLQLVSGPVSVQVIQGGRPQQLLPPGRRYVLKTNVNYCPACRTSLIATRFWVVMICPIIKCLTVLEFSFILLDLCLFITIFNFILNYVPTVTFWIFTYHKIWILLIIFSFIWNYWIIYFNMFGSVLECCELTGVSLLWPWLIKWK